MTTSKTPQRPRTATKTKTAKHTTPTPKRPETATQAPTLAELADLYLKHLEETGKSPATVFSYGMDLKIARGFLGEDTRIFDLKPDQILAFFESDAVTKRKNGQPKTEITVKKTRRVLRLALTWAHEQKLIESVPLP